MASGLTTQRQEHGVDRGDPPNLARARRSQVRFLTGPPATDTQEVHLSDLISAGVLTAGMTLFPARKKHSDRVATLLADGRIEIDGVVYDRPSAAASSVTGKRTGGWWFFLTDQASGTSLRAIRRDYVNAMAAEEDDDEPDDEG